MSWRDILKSPTSIMRNWRYSKTPPSLLYYDYLPTPLKKEFFKIFEEMIGNLQRQFLAGEEGYFDGRHETENMQGMFYISNPEEIKAKQMRFQIAPKDTGMDKHGRFSNYYFYFDKSVSNTDSAPMFMSLDEWDDLLAILVNVKR